MPATYVPAQMSTDPITDKITGSDIRLLIGLYLASAGNALVRSIVKAKGMISHKSW